MPDMFLGRPFFIFARFPNRFFNQDVMSRATDYFFQPRRRAAQARAQVRMLVDGKRELKLPFKPDRRSIHGCTRIKIMCSL
jgi:hypothetical protein